MSNHMPLIVLPGVHCQQITRDFLAVLKLLSPDQRIHIFPTDINPAYCSVSILEFLWDRITIRSTPIMVIAFSAGVAGAIPALNFWQLQGGKVAGLLAIDGWGVPAVGNFPIYRLSHDYFTHWSSALLGAGEINFYADPPVEHLAMWRSPNTVRGWQVTSSNSQRIPTNALAFIIEKFVEQTKWQPECW